MKFVPKKVSQAVGRTVLKAQKNSPTLLFVAGVAGGITATVLACRATLRVNDVLDDHEKDLADLGRVFNTDSRMLTQEFEREQMWIYLRTARRIGTLYAPAVAVGVTSVVCLTKSHNQLMQRNAALTSAYVSLQTFLDGYRSRVRSEVGEEREKDIYYAATPVELVEDTPNGPKKIYGSTPGLRSPYAVVWSDESWVWQDSYEHNLNFIRIQEQLLTDKLRARGHLFLNEVYDKFDIPNTAAGQICGWMIDSNDSDDFVEIEIQPMGTNQRGIMLDFNVAGPVFELLGKPGEKR